MAAMILKPEERPFCNKMRRFSSKVFNLPVRTLSTVANPTAPASLVFLYGYANSNTLVITTQPAVLKAVYDSIINQT